MSYSDTGDGCCDFAIPKDAQQAVKDAFEFLKTSLLKTEEDGSKDWDYGIITCYQNIPLAAAVICCPCWGSCISYRNMEYMSGKSCEVAFVSGMVAGAVCLGPCHYGVVRGQFRKKYGLKGSPCQDWLFGCCLGPCALCSDTNQLMVSQGIKVPYLNLSSGSSSGGKISPA